LIKPGGRFELDIRIILWGGSAIGTWASRQAEAARRGLDWISNRCPLFAAAG